MVIVIKVFVFEERSLRSPLQIQRYDCRTSVGGHVVY